MLQVEMGLDPQVIAEILRARAEDPSKKFKDEAAEMGVALPEDLKEIYLFNELTKISQHLLISPQARQVRLCSEIKVASENATLEVNINILTLTDVTNVFAVPVSGHVRFAKYLGPRWTYLDIFYNGNHAFNA